MTAECKTCYKVRARAYYWANKDKVLAREAVRRSQVDWPARCADYKYANWAKKLLHSAVRSSKARGHAPPTVTEAWILAQSLVCPYLNVSLEPSRRARSPWAPSLDRIDNSKGYTPDNVKLTSWVWNLMRGDLSVEEALAVVERIKNVSSFGKAA